MRYKKGMKVEVLKYSKETQSSSWRTCQVISGNGHTYAVRYDRCPSTDGAGDVEFERVPRKAIRPCPPVSNSPADWIPGDFVEALDDGSWKAATVCWVLDDEDSYLVRLLGSDSNMLRARGSDLRVRQTWQNDQWFSLPKHEKPCSENPNACENGVNHAPRRSSRKMPLESSRPAERSTAEAPRKKRRVIENIISIFPDHCPLVPRKSPVRKVMGSDLLAHHQHRPVAVRAESISSSVGSCSVHSSDPHRSRHGADYDRCSDDAESRCSPRREAASGAETCRPELAEYRRTLKALYESCPATISWEQEGLMAELRWKLNISSDEHVFELKSLLSSSHVS